MCDPILLAATGIGANLVMARYQGEMDESTAEFNASQQRNEAVRIAEAGADEENAFRSGTAQKASRQRAQLAAGGVDVNAGSAYDLQEATFIAGEADALRIRRNAQEQSRVMKESAQLTLLTGRNAKKMAYLRGIASSTGIAASVA